MVGVFGWREPELAAIKILDACWEHPRTPVNPKIFTDAEEIEGFRFLVENEWIGRDMIPTHGFWLRVHGR